MQPEVQDISELTDAQPICMAKQRDGDALGELTQRHRHRCAHFASSLRHAGEAEEETQNACWKVHHIDQFQRRHCRQRHSTPTCVCTLMLNVGGPAW